MTANNEKKYYEGLWDESQAALWTPEEMAAAIKAESEMLSDCQDDGEDEEENDDEFAAENCVFTRTPRDACEELVYEADGIQRWIVADGVGGACLSWAAAQAEEKKLKENTPAKKQYRITIMADLPEITDTMLMVIAYKHRLIDAIEEGDHDAERDAARSITGCLRSLAIRGKFVAADFIIQEAGLKEYGFHPTPSYVLDDLKN